MAKMSRKKFLKRLRRLYLRVCCCSRAEDFCTDIYVGEEHLYFPPPPPVINKPKQKVFTKNPVTEII